MCRWSSSPGLDIVRPCFLRSAPSSGTWCCIMDNLLFQAVLFFPQNVPGPKYVILAALTMGAKFSQPPLISECPLCNKETTSVSVEFVKQCNVLQGIAARQRSRYLRFARPPQEQRLIEARNQTMKEANALALVKYAQVFT